MAGEKDQLAEELLAAWLGLSASVVNSRVVSALTYHESVIAGILRRSPATATELCRRTRISKSQMNRILSSLEGRGLVCRTRSEADRRLVEVSVTPELVSIYDQQHKQVIAVAQSIIDRVGEPRAREATRLFGELARAADKTLAEARASRQPS